MSDAFAGVGTVFKRCDGESSGAGFTALAEINSISGPSMSRETIDVTSLDSTGGYREFITGFRDGGEVTLEMNFTNVGYGQMLDDFEDDDAQLYQIVLSDDDATTLDFAALVTAIPPNIAPDDKVTASITLKVTGQVTLTT